MGWDGVACAGLLVSEAVVVCCTAAGLFSEPPEPELVVTDVVPRGEIGVTTSARPKLTERRIFSRFASVVVVAEVDEALAATGADAAG